MLIPPYVGEVLSAQIGSSCSGRTRSLEEAHAQTDGLWDIVTELKQQNDEIRQQNEELREQVKELRERIGKSSLNSSRPPSSDSLRVNLMPYSHRMG
ncbi:DUF6444 domain-containing protein [Granulosicoccus sp. 3-233]|uniref:DUF6444 domain-containing protein n=1 Tax=Granulosicoccus sp. 3-233 TaxID=3417969 RepID=UPI003D33C0E0